MSIQVSPLTAGGSINPPVIREQKPQPRLPIENDAVEVNIGAEALAGTYNPGTQKSQTSDLQQTTSELENISLAFNRRLKFEINYDSKEVIVKVIDNETDKVIRVLPPEELQRLHSRIRETIGFLFDRRV